MQQVKVSNLTPEAQTTLQQIQSGGSFPYPQDGSVFKNLEKKLPVKPPNYYVEYTTSQKLIKVLNGFIKRDRHW